MSEPESIERRKGRGIVVRGNDIDTDQIIPGRFLRSITFVGLEEHVFADVRRTPDGVLKGHPFDQEHFEGASILVVNRNFGCGSSREHAPQALMRWGIRAIVGESFAEIFFGNCIALGIPAVTGSPGEIAALMDAIELDPSQEISLDLESMTVTSRAGTIRIRMPEGARTQLVEGTWDAMRTLLTAADDIDAVAARLPYVRGF
jgi:3-isopropylmalate/(R)-2-methylmalate dehydratase small subunit